VRKFFIQLLLLVISLLFLFFFEAQAQKRSFVGKRLSGATFVDTEGHVINPDHYKDSVLVMFAGIPW
jgi:hypothetical protein